MLSMAVRRSRARLVSSRVGAFAWLALCWCWRRWLVVPDFIYNIGTTVLNGGISMIIFFFVNKIIFPEGEAAK